MIYPVEQMFISVLNMSFTGAIVILAVMALRILFRRAPKFFSYVLWIAVLFRLLCPVSFSSAFSLLEVLRVPLAKSGQIDYIPENIGLMEHPEINLPVPAVGDAVNASLPSAVMENSVNPMQALVLAGACLWAAGIVLMAGYSIGVYWKMKRKLGTAVWERENIYCISGFGTPFVCGIIFPRIYLPPLLEEKEKAYILLHEQIHLKRKDHIWRMVGYIALCIHWFNPLAWVAFFQSGKDMEMSCDEAVIRIVGDNMKKAYSASLLSFASGRRVISAVPPAFGEGEAGGRIKNILRYKKPAKIMTAAAVIISVFVLAVLLANPETGGKQANMDSSGDKTLSGNEVSEVYYGIISNIDMSGDGGEVSQVVTIPGIGDAEIPKAEEIYPYMEAEPGPEQVSFLTTEQLMQDDVEDGKYRAYVYSISRSARGIDGYFAGLEDNGRLPFLAFAENCRFFIDQETDHPGYEEVSFEEFADLAQERFSYQSPPFLLVFENGKITEAVLEDF